MRLVVRQACWCLVCLLMWARAGAAEVVTFDEGSPPTMYADARGQASGVYPAIVARAFVRMKMPLDARAMPFKRLIAELQAGKAGMGGIIRTPERDQLADFSEAYVTERLFAYARSEAGRVPPSGLAGHVVGVIRGWSYGSQFDAARARGDFQVVEFSQDKQGFESLLQGRIDRMVSTELAAAMLLRDPRMATIRAAEGTIMSFGIHLAFSKRMQKTAVLKAFDQAVDEMRREGELDRIVQDEVSQAAIAVK